MQNGCFVFEFGQARKMKVLSVPSAEDATASSKSSNNSSSASSVTVCGPKGDGMGLPALSRLLQSRMKNAPTGMLVIIY